MKAGAPPPTFSKIRGCVAADLPAMLEIINDAAIAYKGVIPTDRWHKPYMPGEELNHEIAAGVRFEGYVENGILLGVMGIQDVKDVTLIRHAYVRTSARNQGIGGKLLAHLITQTQRPILIGTWAAATWAIHFYERHGFTVVAENEKNVLLRKYWSIPDRQIATSVVLVDKRFDAVSHWKNHSLNPEEHDPPNIPGIIAADRSPPILLFRSVRGTTDARTTPNL